MRYTIRGTNIELRDPTPSTRNGEKGLLSSSDKGTPVWVPLSWVTQTAHRPEPPVGKTEADRYGRPWHRRKGGWFGGVIGSYLPWEKLQDRFGPTLPMDVIDE